MPSDTEHLEADHPESVPADDRVRQEALMEAYTTYRPSLAAYCLQIGVKAHDVDDLLQEVWIIANKYLHALREPRAIGLWIRRIIWSRTRILDSRRPEVAGGDVETWMDDASESPLERLVAEERAALARTALDEVCELDRRTLEEFYLQGHSIGQIAVIENAPAGTIKRRLHVARKRLKERLHLDLTY